MELSQGVVIVLPAQMQRQTNKTASEMSSCLIFNSLPSLKLFNKPITKFRPKVLDISKQRNDFFLIFSHHQMSWISTIKCHVTPCWGRRHTPLLCNERRKPQTRHYLSRAVTNQQTTHASHYLSRPAEQSFEEKTAMIYQFE